MRLIRPIAIGPANLVSSNLPETDAPAWSNVTTYAENDQALFGHRVYSSLIDGNTDNQPDTGAVADPPTWLDLGPSNRYRMFDGSPSTTSQRDGSIQFVVDPGRGIDTVGLINVSAVTVTVERLAAGGGVAWSETKDLDDVDPLGNGEVDFLTDLVFLDIPLSAFRVRVTVDASGGTAKVGAVVIGRQAILGDTEFGANISIRDYSRKDVDDFGDTRIVKRAYIKTGDFSIALDTPRLGAVQRALAAVRAEAVLYVGVSYRSETFLYGFYKGFTLVIAGPVRSTGSIEVESLTYEADDALFPAVVLEAPSITSPTEDEVIATTATITGSAFSTAPTGSDTHAKSDWQIASDSGFTTVVHQSLNDVANKTAYALPPGALDDGEGYYVRVRYHGTVLGASAWSAGVEFTTEAPVGSVDTPSITSPDTDGDDQSAGGTITSSAFATTGDSDTHASSDWQLSTVSNFATVLAQSLSDATHLVSWTLPGGLTNGTTYYVRVRHRGTALGTSAWSEPREFVLADAWDGLGDSYVSDTYRASGVASASVSVNFHTTGTWSVVMNGNGTTYRGKNGAAFSGSSDTGNWITGSFSPDDYEIQFVKTAGDTGSGLTTWVPLTSTRSFSINAVIFGDYETHGMTVDVSIRPVASPGDVRTKSVRIDAYATSNDDLR